MRNIIKTVAVLVLLGGRAGTVQAAETERSAVGDATAPAPFRLTQATRLAPIGHRQPQARDIPSQNPRELERLTDEDAAVDRKLVICRGC